MTLRQWFRETFNKTRIARRLGRDDRCGHAWCVRPANYDYRCHRHWDDP